MTNSPCNCAFYERIDHILSVSSLAQEFIGLPLVERGVNSASASARRLERFANWSVLALRANIAHSLTGLDHREFCATPPAP